MAEQSLGSVPRNEMDGLRMDINGPFWDVDGPKNFCQMLNALKNWIPEDSMLYSKGDHLTRRSSNS